MIEERKRFPRITEDANRRKAKSKEILLEPSMWEDALPGRVRPQERINKDKLMNSDLVVMLLWKRWGSPTGEYSSGFEEEYEVARPNKKEIWLYFRSIPDSLLNNPDEQVKNVLEFRRKVESEKNLFFIEYKDEEDWERKFTDHLYEWLDRKYAPAETKNKELIQDREAVLRDRERARKEVPRSGVEWVGRLVEDIVGPANNDISQPNDRKLFLQEFVKKCNSSSKYKLTRACILLDIKDFQYDETTLLSDIWIEEHQLDEEIVRRHLSSFGKKETKQIMKSLQDVYIQELGHMPYEAVIAFSFSSMSKHDWFVKYEKDRVVNKFNRFSRFTGSYHYFEPHSQEFRNTGAKYNLYKERAFFCGLCLGSVQIPIFCITSMNRERTLRASRSFGSKTDDFGDLFDRLMLTPLTERDWAVMIIEWIAGLVASSYRALKIIPRR